MKKKLRLLKNNITHSGLLRKLPMTKFAYRRYSTFCENESRYGFPLGKRPLTKELYVHGSAGVPLALNGIQGIGQIAITKVSVGDWYE